MEVEKALCTGVEDGPAAPGQRWQWRAPGRVVGVCLALALTLAVALGAARTRPDARPRLHRGMGGFIQKSQESVTAQISWAINEDYCLSVSKKDSDYGKQLQLSKCTDVERFIVDLSEEGGLIRPENLPNDCLNAPTAEQESPTQLQFWPCEEVEISSHLEFKWGVSNPDMIHLKSNPSRCIDVPTPESGATLDGIKLQLWGCGPDSNPDLRDTFNLLTDKAEPKEEEEAPSTTTEQPTTEEPIIGAKTTGDSEEALVDPDAEALVDPDAGALVDPDAAALQEPPTTTEEPGGGWGWFR